MKKMNLGLTLILFVFSVGTLFAQAKPPAGTTKTSSTLGGDLYSKDHIKDRKPMPYQFVREADFMWSKIVWRKINLREKMNLPLYYPQKPMGTRMSLIDLMLSYIDDSKAIGTEPRLTAYDANPSAVNEFEKPITFREIVENKFDVKSEVKKVIDPGTGEERSDTIPGELKSWEVKEYLVKEQWFFDKQRSVLEVRILGMCPIRYYFKPTDTEFEDPQKKMTFWVMFTDLRRIFAKNEVFNVVNDSEYKSFDDIFAKRFFSSYITQETNVYENRQIDQYTQGMESLLEAERIKSNIQNFESDLWEY